MSLRSKIVIILSAVVAVYALTDHVIQRVTVSRSFVMLERQKAIEDVKRVLEAIEKEVGNLDKLCFDWSVRDQTYEFVENQDRGYVESNLGPNTFRSNRIELFYICNNQGQVVWGDIRDPENGEQLQLREFPRQALLPSHPLLLLSQKALSDPLKDFKRGLFPTEHGPLLVSSRPILPSDGGGPARGRVIVGKFLDAKLIEGLFGQTKVPFEAWPLDGTELPPDAELILDQVTASQEPIIREHGKERLYLYTTIGDLNNYPALLLRAETERDISAAGATSVRYALLSTIASGLILLLVLLALLQKTVIAPLSALTAHAVEIGSNEDFTAKIDLDRDDEIGILSREFDNMMDKLSQSRAELAETARAAGMSEIATGILHNVGNVLNSVNVSASMVAKRTDELAVSDLEALSKALTDNADDLASFVSTDPRGKQIQPYLHAVAGHLRSAQEGIAKEVESLTGGIEHIRELINSQQGLARRTGFSERVKVSEQVEAALNISNRALTEDNRMSVEREYEDLTVTVDKHKLLEIMVNLIQNARQAMQSIEGERRLTLRVVDNRDLFRIEVADTGIGIAADSLVKVFNLGFTTKSNGHGFGLHAAANAASTMGGALTVRSEGIGRGATFVLELPVGKAAAEKSIREAS
jgi:sensor domain CHASE-containing protein